MLFFAILPNKNDQTPIRIQLILSQNDSGVQSPPKRIVKGEAGSLGLKELFLNWNLVTNSIFTHYPGKSKSTKLCPLVVGDSFTWITLKTILCLVLDFQGYIGILHIIDYIDIMPLRMSMSCQSCPCVWS